VAELRISRLSVFVGSLVAFTTIKAQSQEKDVFENVKSYFSRQAELSSALEDSRSDIKVELRSAAREHYEGIKQTYLVKPFETQKKTQEIILNRLVQKTKVTSQNRIPGATAIVEIVLSGITGSERAAIEACLLKDGSPYRQFDFLTDRRTQGSRVFSSVLESLKAGKPMSETEESNLNALKDLVQLDESFVKQNTKNCCETHRGSNTQISCDSLATKAESEFRAAAEIAADLKIAPVAFVPNPLQDSSLRPSMVAEIIRTNRSQFQALRRGSQDNSVKAIEEEDLFLSLEDKCKEEANKKQEKAGSILGGPIMNPILKALKCTILPTVATLYADKSVQSIALGVGGVNIQDQSEGWDINCDPRTLAALDQARPTDPNLIAQQWGLAQLANPPWIQNLRTLPMLGTPFSVTPLPGGGFMTPYGSIAQPDMPAGGVVGASGQSSGSAARRERAAAARQGPPGNNRSRVSGRRLAQTSQATGGVRSLAGEISRGRSVDQSLSTLKSGSTQTRALASKIRTQNTKRGLANVAKERTNSAAQARTAVRNLGGARASRTTSDNILSSLRGRGRTGSGPTGSPTVEDVRKATERERRRIEQLVRQYMDNIETAKAKAEETRVKIMQKVADHDLATTKVLERLMDKPPRKQAKIMMDLRTELSGITRELAELKSSFDIYQASIMEQGMLIRNLAAFGTQAANFPGFGGQVDPNKIPQGFPRVPGRGRGSRSGFWDSFKKMEWVSKAWANTPAWGVFESPEEWQEAWDLHLKEYEKYAASRKNIEAQELKVAANILNTRFDKMESSPDDSDTDTLLAMYDFSETLSQEMTTLIEDNSQKKNNLTGNQLALVRKIQTEASESVEQIEGIFLDSKDTYSKNPDDNPTPYLELLQSYLTE
jgi:hypothetical protein